MSAWLRLYVNFSIGSSVFGIQIETIGHVETIEHVVNVGVLPLN